MRLLRVVVLGLAGMVAFGLHADDKKRTLPGPHTQAKLICFDCHQKEKPVTAAVPDEACMVCHGDYPAMKALTKKVPHNPHDSPHEPIFCTECHHQHKPQTVQCLECHADWKLVVPPTK